MSDQNPVRILGVCGSTSPDSRTRTLLDVSLDAARQAGAEVRVIDLSETILPIMVERDAAQAALPEVQLVRESADWAEGFLLATPEYHGALSGGLKNWFDFLWEQLAGKVAGVLATTYAGHADQALLAVKNSFQWCHGWTLPFQVAAHAGDWEGAALTGVRARDRAERMGHDLVHFARLLHGAFEDRKGMGKEDPTAGFAGLHAR